MPDRKIVQLFPPVDESPDSDERAARARADAERADQERRETHIREEVAKIPPLPQGVEALATYGARMARDVRIELIQMRVHAGHARDMQSAETREIHGKIDWIVGALSGLGSHVEQRDSVSNEAALETAAKVESARRVATEAKAEAAEAKADAVEAKTVARTLKDIIPESTWAKGGKATVTLGMLAAVVEGIARAVGIDGLAGLAGKIFGGH